MSSVALFKSPGKSDGSLRGTPEKGMSDTSAGGEKAGKDAQPQGYEHWAALGQYKTPAAFPNYYPHMGPQHHPYMGWGGQPMMPPYATPPNPYYAGYHPAMAPPPQYGYSVPPVADPMAAGRAKGAENGEAPADWGKTAGLPTSPAGQGRGDSGSEGSSGSDSGDVLHGKRSFDGMTGDKPMGANGAAANGSYPYPQDGSAPMWQGVGAPRRGGPSSMPSDVLQYPTVMDEREVKRQRRKQSNRESARRSRLRKQAECEDLGSRVSTLVLENTTMKAELIKLQEKLNQITADRDALLEQCKAAGVVPVLPSSGGTVEVVRKASPEEIKAPEIEEAAPVATVTVAEEAASPVKEAVVVAVVAADATPVAPVDPPEIVAPVIADGGEAAKE